MIGLDTNVLIRAVVADEPGQVAKARRLFEGLSAKNPGYINLVVVAEIAWVLRRRYQYDRSQIADTLESLISQPDLEFEEAELVESVIEEYRRSRADLTDLLIGARNRLAGCETTFTFDRKSAELTTLMTAL